ncbi:hypothetical protein ASPACDRAFT_15237, partial [Aspergillus aculeatus ATCC 16872]
MSPLQFPIDAITSRFGDRFNSVRSQSFSTRFANLRPVSEFLDVKRISKPANFGEVQSRVNYNLSYFSSNYAAVFVMLSIYSLLTNPVLLFVIIFVTGGLYGIGKLQGRDLDLGVARFNTSQLYTGLLLVAVPLGFWASPIATVLWLIGATGVAVFVGRQTRRRAAPWVDESSRVEELDSEDDDMYSRQDMRISQARQAADREINEGSIRRRRMVEYDAFYEDEMAAVDEMDYDLQDSLDSTVAYAVQLAMKDKEERLVDQALDRIRHAQAQGQKNVRLSKRELEAIERMRTGSRSVTGEAPRGGGSYLSSSPRKHSVPSPLAENNSAYAFWARTSGASHNPEASPRSPPCRSQSSHTPPRSPLQPAYSLERLPSVPLVRNPGSMRRPALTRPLHDDTQWVPSRRPLNPIESPLYPLDPRRDSVDHSEKTSMSSYRNIFDDRPNGARSATMNQGWPGRVTEQYPREDAGNRSSGLEDSSDEVHMVDVLERRVPLGMPTRMPVWRGSYHRGSR